MNIIQEAVKYWGRLLLKTKKTSSTVSIERVSRSSDARCKTSRFREGLLIFLGKTTLYLLLVTSRRARLWRWQINSEKKANRNFQRFTSSWELSTTKSGFRVWALNESYGLLACVHAIKVRPKPKEPIEVKISVRIAPTTQTFRLFSSFSRFRWRAEEKEKQINNQHR